MCEQKIKIKELSILIPTFNDECGLLVDSLTKQLSKQHALAWEIIVADDGSTNKTVLNQNRRINLIDGCRVIERNENVGRASIRNFLGRTAQYDTLLFVDADMSVENEDFIEKYLQQSSSVVYGGYDIKGESDTLRFRYEKACETNQKLDKRMQNQYNDFHTSNFLISRNIFIQYPLDEHFRKYGYEDVFYGKQLQKVGIEISHIDNPTTFNIFEEDEVFIAKTDEALETLIEFSSELEGFSRLHEIRKRINSLYLDKVIRPIARPILPTIRRYLCKGGAPLWLFHIYKLLRII